MFNKESQLLCTFTNSDSYENEIESLANFYTVDGGRIYILQNVDNQDEIFLTFNALKSNEKYYPKTISVHRKRDFNVLYSINALNELVKLENNGVFSATFNIPWDHYRNSIITTKDGKLKITPTKLVKIFRL